MPIERDPIDIELGTRIRALRRARGISLRQFGERIGKAYQQAQKYERGADRIAVATLLRIAEALDATPTSLLVGLTRAGGDDLALTPAEQDLVRLLRTLPDDATTAVLALLRAVVVPTR